MFEPVANRIVKRALKMIKNKIKELEEDSSINKEWIKFLKWIKDRK